MNKLHLCLMLSPVLLAGAGAVLAAPQGTGLVRVPAQLDAESQGKRVGFCADEWRTKITSPDLDQREQDFAALLEAARRDPDVRAEVQSWARGSDDELAWTARLLLRELESNPRFGRTATLWMPDAGDPFWFDAVAGDLGFGSGSLFAAPQPGAAGTFALPGGRALAVPSQPGAGLQSSQRQFSLESGPDGVVCKVIEEENGERKEREYKAESIEKLLQDHPELGAQIGVVPGLGGSPLQFPGGALNLRLFPNGMRGQLAAPDADGPRTDILGVYVHPLAAGEAKQYALEDGVGLVVERRQPGSIAEALGIQRGHVLIEMNGKKLHSSEDITAELRARDPNAGIQIELIDRWGQHRTRTWKPEPESNGGAVPASPFEKDTRDV